MDRQKINLICGIVPLVFSLLAFGDVIVALLTGAANGATDEGAAAHIFQLLIVAEGPFILGYVATAEWNRVVRCAGLIALQAATLVLAFAPVVWFNL